MKLFSKSKPAVLKAEEEKRIKEEVQTELTALTEHLTKAKERVREFKKLINETALIQEEVKEISLKAKKSIKTTQTELKALSTKSDFYKESFEKLNSLKEDAEALREIRPETWSLFNRMFLGRVNVKMWTIKDRLRLRDEYNKFKFRTMWLHIAFPSVVLFSHYYLRHQWKDTHWINIFHELWLLYYYITLAIRENILMANGSSIRNWWLYHHYLAAFATVTYLVWPLTPTYLSYVPYFNSLALYNGVLQILRNWYHGRREYANRALGKIGHMDVTYKETLTEFPNELWIILPFLILAHFWEVSLGISLLNTFARAFDPSMHWTEYTEELQMFASGVLNIIMGFGNFLSVVATINTKRVKAKQGRIEHKAVEKIFPVNGKTPKLKES